MAAARFLLYLTGAAMVVAGLALMYVWGGLEAWIPVSIALALLVLIVGFLIMRLSDRAPRGQEPRHEQDRRPDPDGGRHD